MKSRVGFLLIWIQHLNNVTGNLSFSIINKVNIRRIEGTWVNLRVQSFSGSPISAEYSRLNDDPQRCLSPIAHNL